MIRGNGVDIVDLRRFHSMEQHRLDRLAKRILTATEYSDFLSTPLLLQHRCLAKYWAVKEAVAKSFGTGIRGNVAWKNIEMRKTHLGQPRIYLQSILHHPGLICHISISHDGEYVIAYAILEHVY
jgi:holo-[acyl-carrier protein] synthase